MKKVILLLIILLTANSFLFPIIKLSHRYIENKIISSKILNKSKNYLKAESEYSCIYYSIQDKEYIRLIKSTIDLYYPELLKDFNLKKPSHKIIFVVYPDSKSMKDSLNLQSDSFPMGAYYGGIINIASPQLWAGNNEIEIKHNFLRQGPIIHEISHLLLDKKTNGNYPLWFSEGVALYYEHKYTGFTFGYNNNLTQISYDELSKNFRNLDEVSAYKMSFDIINKYVQLKGAKELQKLIYNLRVDIFDVY